MRKSAYLLLLFALAVPTLQADVIYSNFGVDPDPYDPNHGVTVVAGGVDNRLSFSFVIPNSPSYQLTAIDFAAYIISDPNAIIASIYDDNAGVPGNLVYTTGEIDNALQAPSASTFNEELEETVTNGPILTAGSTYWLTLDGVMTNGEYDSVIAWSYNGQGAGGNYAILTPDGWNTGSRTQGAFEIDGVMAPAPEPVSTVLVGSGLAMAAFFNRRRFVRRPSPTKETF